VKADNGVATMTGLCNYKGTHSVVLCTDDADTWNFDKNTQTVAGFKKTWCFL